MIAQEPRRLRRLDDHDARKNVRLLMQAGDAHIRHPPSEAIKIEEDLRLDELSAELNLTFETGDALDIWVSDAAKEKRGGSVSATPD